ncbi:MAG: sigma-70 family RNA polymerase sigma factor [Terrimicrobiaceae bacterium]|nr:sigma-70 family RNA polymerase sigma factor [Terrimicrobiaceae bacterium]
MVSGELANEADLLAQSRLGNTRAFDRLITLHRDRVYMVAYHILRNNEEALDVVQESFLRAWKGLARFDGTASLGSWLSRIASNASIDVIRRRQAHPQTEFEAVPMAIDAASRTTPAQPAKPGESVDQAEIRERFERALGTLSPEHRAVILLKEIEDLSYQEIADTVGCSIGTVMSRLFYARKKLQTELRDLYEEL